MFQSGFRFGVTTKNIPEDGYINHFLNSFFFNHFSIENFAMYMDSQSTCKTSLKYFKMDYGYTKRKQSYRINTSIPQ